jgi:hypothetical protein
MTRHKWADLRDRHLDTPEKRAHYEEVKAKLDADLEEFYRLRRERPEWFEDSRESG